MHFILKEKDTEDGDYIVRARGAWFGNRTISAEVDLEPGVYEVLPKIEAKRNINAPDVHEVVTKVAERNPQKLRQIGLNYDIANAKGFVELTEEEQKQKDQKKKEAAEKKKQEKEAADKEKADFEAWKKGEKEEYEAWKKEKKRLEEKPKAAKSEAQTDDATPAVPEKEDASRNASEEKENGPVTSAAGSNDTTTAKDATPGAEEAKSANATSEVELITKTAELKVDDVNPHSDDEGAQHTPDEGPELPSRASSRPVSRGRRLPPHMYRGGPRSYYGDEPQQEAGPRAHSPEDNKPKPWNAVCVLGLRVYSQDSEVSIKLLKPKTVEEGAILDVGGDTAAGATM